MDNQALRLSGLDGAGARCAWRGRRAALSVLKLFGSEASQLAIRICTGRAGSTASRIPASPARTTPFHLDFYRAGLVRALCRSFGGTSPAERPKSNATSSPSECWAAPQLKESAVYIDYEVADRIATITLNRPEAANAQNPELLDELDAAWTRAAEDNDVA
jgi:hypothetical protein